MKKMTLLFLALSAVAFGAASTNKGANQRSTISTKASIDINVTATVLDNPPALIITNENDEEISSVEFNHEIAAGTNSDLLTANLRVAGNAIDKQFLSTNDLGELTLLNSTDDSKTITTTLSASIGDSIGENKFALDVTSNLNGTNTIAGESYTKATKQLTVTFEKSNSSNGSVSTTSKTQ